MEKAEPDLISSSALVCHCPIRLLQALHSDPAASATGTTRAFRAAWAFGAATASAVHARAAKPTLHSASLMHHRVVPASIAPRPGTAVPSRRAAEPAAPERTAPATPSSPATHAAEEDTSEQPCANHKQQYEDNNQQDHGTRLPGQHHAWARCPDPLSFIQDTEPSSRLMDSLPTPRAAAQIPPRHHPTASKLKET